MKLMIGIGIGEEIFPCQIGPLRKFVGGAEKTNDGLVKKHIFGGYRRLMTKWSITVGMIVYGCVYQLQIFK